MVTSSNKKPRRQHILESFARMLEAGPGTRITTAALAKEVGVSEAALYRHFPSKTKMFEGLIEFIEEAVFTRINLIESEESVNALERCEKILQLLLGFAERNPGITRILTGDAIAGETSRLHSRVVQFFDRIETQMRQILREAELSEGLHFGLSVNVTVKIWLAAAEGRIAQYVRSQFRDLPTTQWKEQWPYLVSGFVVPAPSVEAAATTA